MPPARRRRVDSSEGKSLDPKDIQVVRLDVPCGWCMTGDHKNCKQELVFPPKNWICGCKHCNMKDYIPKIGVESKPANETKQQEEPDSDDDSDNE